MSIVILDQLPFLILFVLIFYLLLLLFLKTTRFLFRRIRQLPFDPVMVFGDIADGIQIYVTLFIDLL
tara:strand:+ start:173 stop:373 length:201 start_codon:yes stop_codon:yes gene_type:complete